MTRKLDSTLKKGYATVWDQCSQEVPDKLEASKDWDHIERDQSFHNLIKKIKRIFVGFDNQKQEIFNLVQALRTLFLYYKQTEKESEDKFTRNFMSLWYKIDVFWGSPGVHNGLVNALLATPGRVGDRNNVTMAELQAACWEPP